MHPDETKKPNTLKQTHREAELHLQTATFCRAEQTAVQIMPCTALPLPAAAVLFAHICLALLWEGSLSGGGDPVRQRDVACNISRESRGKGLGEEETLTARVRGKAELCHIQTACHALLCMSVLIS